MSNFLNSKWLGGRGGSSFYIPSVIPIVNTPATETLSSTTVSGGSVSSFSSGTLTLSENELYMYQVYIKNSTATSLNTRHFINGDTTDGNYRSGNISSAGALETYDSSYPFEYNVPASTLAICTGWLGLQNGKPFCTGEIHSQQATTRRTVIGAGFHNSANTLTSMTVRVTNAVGIGNGSYLKIFKVLTAPIFSTTVVGASVTTISLTGINLEPEKTYFLFTGINGETPSNSASSFLINNDNTAANYKNGSLSSNGTRIDTTGLLTTSTVQANGFHTSYGVIGVNNSTSYMRLHMGDNPVTGRVSYKSVFNTTQTTFTSLHLTSSVASWLKAGSFMKIYQIGD